MMKVERPEEVSTCESLHSDILVKIFNKLDIIDITIGASRVCKFWFLTSHNKTLWKTIDFTMIHRFKPIIYHKYWNDFPYRDDIRNESVSVVLRRYLIDILTKVTNLSRMEPESLSFRLNSYTQEEDLMFVAERMPNIEKLVLLDYWYDKRDTRCAFSLWKNLKTLIVTEDIGLTQRFMFSTVGKNCTNLTNLKYTGDLQDHSAEGIVIYLANLKRLSLKGSYITITGVLLLITHLENLKILNLSHCKDMFPGSYPIAKSRDYFEQDAPQKLEKFITCSQDCSICRDPLLCDHSKDWRNDEIKEFEF